MHYELFFFMSIKITNLISPEKNSDIEHQIMLNDNVQFSSTYFLFLYLHIATVWLRLGKDGSYDK